MLLLSYLSVFSIIGLVCGYPQGPPLSVCKSLLPDSRSHSSNINQRQNKGFLIATDIPYNETSRYYSYTAGQDYVVQIRDESGTTFRGFVVQATDPSGVEIGTFIANDMSQQILTCSELSAATISTDKKKIGVQAFTWIAPDDNDGFVDFMYTVVRVRDNHFAALKAGEQKQITLVGQNITAPPANDLGKFVRAHGILMIIAWPMLGFTSVFFAAWMRPALPNGQWFQVHRILMLGSLVIGIVGFFIIFVGERHRNPPGLIPLNKNPNQAIGIAHFTFGTVIMLLHIINPLVSLCRCHPGAPYRWVYYLIHGAIIGYVVIFLALINVGIGIAWFSKGFSQFAPSLTVFYVYLGYVIFFVLLVMVLFILFTVISCTSQEEDRANLAPSPIKPLIRSHTQYDTQQEGVELVAEKSSKSEAENIPKIPSHDAPLRWIALAIFLLVTIVLMTVLIILIAI